MFKLNSESIWRKLKLSLALMLKNAKKRIDKIIKKDKRKILLLCVLLLVVFVGVVSAIVYSSMFIENTIGVGN